MFLILIVFFVSLISNLTFSEDKQKLALWSLQKNFGYQRNTASAISMIESAEVKDYAKSLEKLFGNEAIVQTSPNGDKITLIVNKDFFYYRDESELREASMATTRQFLDIIKTRAKATDNPKFSIVLSGTNFALDSKRLAFFKENLQEIQLDVGINYDNDNHLIMISEIKQ